MEHPHVNVMIHSPSLAATSLSASNGSPKIEMHYRKSTLNFTPQLKVGYFITEEDAKSRFNDILIVNVFQHPYLNEITCTYPFR